MNRPCYSTFVLGLLLLAGSSTAQQAPQIDIDYASFAYDEQESLVELYMAVKAKSLTYEAGDSLYISTFPLELSLLSSSDTDLDASAERVVWEQEMDLQFAVMDTSVITKGQVFLRQVRLTVIPGKYSLQIVMHLSGQDSVWTSRDLIIPDYSQQESCGLSDITLASSITPSEDREDPFYKNGLRIRPNASQLFGEGAANLFYYAEAYNTACAASDTGEYTMVVYVSKESKPEPITGLEKYSKRAVRPTDVLVGRLDLSALVSGIYSLHIVILGNANKSKVEQTRKFLVFNPVADSALAQNSAARETFETSIYATMPQDDVEEGSVRCEASSDWWYCYKPLVPSNELVWKQIRIRPADDVTAVVIIHEPPELIGGIRALQRKIKVPRGAFGARSEGRVIVQFMVDEEGLPRDFVILRGMDGGWNEEAIRVIAEHARFKPAIGQGRAVPVRMSLPIIIRSRASRSFILRQ